MANTNILIERSLQLKKAEELLKESFQNLECGRFQEAKSLLDSAHAIDYDNKEIQLALRICGFWTQRVKTLDEINDCNARADYLRYQWSVFTDRYSNENHLLDELQSKLNIWVNGQALDYYRSHIKEFGDSHSIFQAARCLKALGLFEDAAKNLESFLAESQGTDACCMAELADTYALIGEIKPAKILMREALFIDADKVHLNQLHAPVFVRLIESVAKNIDRNIPSFNEWISVYGVLWGVLNIKRELKADEYGKLKQMIYALKSEIVDGDESGKLTPRLINRYFRLIDHYQIIGSDRSEIEDIMMNIKLLSPIIYDKYLK